jgi:hypothetical protein
MTLMRRHRRTLRFGKHLVLAALLASLHFWESVGFGSVAELWLCSLDDQQHYDARPSVRMAFFLLE